MKDLQEERLAKLVKEAFLPHNELDRDLWPQLRDKLQGSRIKVPWFDWLLAAMTIILFLLMPEVFAALLFNL